MKFTRWMGQCSQYLAYQNQTPGGQKIKILVDLAFLSCRVTECFSSVEVGASDFRKDRALDMSMKTFQNELDGIRAALPADQIDDCECDHTGSILLMKCTDQISLT
jgi:hypothetical protein